MSYTPPAPTVADFAFPSPGAYTAPAPAAGNFDFTPPIGGDRTVTIDGALPDLAGPVQVIQGQFTTIAGSFVALGGEVNVLYVSDTARPMVGKFDAVEQLATPLAAGADLQWVDAIPAPLGVRGRSPRAAPRPAGWDLVYREALAFALAHQARYQAARALNARPALFGYQDSRSAGLGSIGRYQDGAMVPAAGAGVRFQQGVQKWDGKRGRFQLAAIVQPVGAGLRFNNGRPVAVIRRNRYQDAGAVLAGISEHPVHPPGPVDPELPEASVVVPIRRIYTVINSATLRRVDGDLLIPTVSMSLTIDTDSWTWGFTARTPGAALPDLEPVGGQPVEVEATINGVAYRAIIEGISRERTFGRSDLAVSGRGKAAVLDAPYSPLMTFGNPTADRTVQQLANDVLTLNGVSIGWDVNAGWAPDNWIVPAGVWTHQGSYITALNAIATAAGAYVQPHRTDKALSVLRRYPAKPWEWDDVTPDFELPSDVVQKEAVTWSDKAIYNRVFVRGMKSGVLGQVTRSGTAGDLEAPMVTDPLITDAIGARQRALPVLADVGRQAAVSLRLPVLAETGIIAPGKFVRYVDTGVTRMGLVRSVSAEVQRADKKLTIWQTIGVETHVSV